MEVLQTGYWPKTILVARSCERAKYNQNLEIIMSCFTNSLFIVVGCWLMLMTGGLSASAQVSNSKGKFEFTQSDMAKLRWIEGAWRGSDAEGKLIFYENYNFVANEIVIKSYAQDSTFTKVKRQGKVYLQNGEIIHKGEGMLWSATK
jgi:hypothetical protein